MLGARSEHSPSFLALPRVRALILAVILTSPLASHLVAAAPGAVLEAPPAEGTWATVEAPVASPADLPSALMGDSFDPTLTLAPPAPQPLSTASYQNWSPYSPPVFTWGTVDLQARSNAVVFGATPTLTVNQSGNVTLRLNGTWNPAPATAAPRDWVMVLSVIAGSAAVHILQTNKSLVLALRASEVPARFYFVLPSPVALSVPVSTAVVNASYPPGNFSVLNLTVASAAVSLAARQTVAPVATSSVWLNASGSYAPGGLLNVSQNLTGVLPLNGLPPMAVASGSIVHWTGPGNFPGARVFLFATSNPGGGPAWNDTLVMWTRASPESGLSINASLVSTNVSRGENISVSGRINNLTLGSSSTWSVNTTSVLGINHPYERCDNLLRLQNGSWRLFCNFQQPVFNSTPLHGVDSAFSPDGVSWSWEPGTRYEACGGTFEIDRISIARALDGTLTMYYTGRDPQGCNGDAFTHIAIATSADEGSTWAYGADNTFDMGFGPGGAVAAPTPDGGYRFFVYNDTTFFAFTFDSAASWFDGNVSANHPRCVYLLSDGSYKMFYGTTNVYSQTSWDATNWSSPRLEVANWSGDIEAGPVLDDGNGTLTLLLYSQASGLFLALLQPAGVGGADVTLAATTSDEAALDPTVVTTDSNGYFVANVALPAESPLGPFEVTATADLGGVSLHGSVVNRAPLWTGPANIDAVEDIPLFIDLSNWTLDPDESDSVSFNASSNFSTLVGSVLRLNYSNGILSDVVVGSFTDGFVTVPFRLNVTVAAVDDPPTIALNSVYTALEDRVSAMDLTGTYADEETPPSLLTLSTNITGATVAGALVLVNFTLPGSYPVTIGVSDGNSTVNSTTTIDVTPADDAPQVSLDAVYLRDEDGPIVLNFNAPAIFDEDTPPPSLVLSTNLTNATVSGLVVTLAPRNLPGDEPFLITVTDGTSTVAGTSLLRITPVNDPPRWVDTPRASPIEETPFELNLAPLVFDEDNGTGELTFSSDSPYAVVNGSRLVLTYPEGFLSDSLTLTVSDGLANASVNVLISVRPMNDPPTLLGNPPTEVQPGHNATYQFVGTDAEQPVSISFEISSSEPWISLTPQGYLMLAPPSSTHGRFGYNVSVVDSQGGRTTRAFEVGVGNHAPVIGELLGTNPYDGIPGIPYVHAVEITDEDGDPLVVTLVSDDPRMTIDPATYEVRWVPIRSYVKGDGIDFTLNFTVSASDGLSNASRTFSVRVRDPPDVAPLITRNFAPVEGMPDTSAMIDLRGASYDSDDPDSNLTWRIEGDLDGDVAIYRFEPSALSVMVFFRHPGEGTLKLVLSDPSGKTDTRNVTVRTLAPGAQGSAAPAGDPSWWWLLALAAAGAVGVAVVARARRGAGPKEAATTRAPPARPAGAGAGPRGPNYLVEDVFLLHGDGRPIWTRGGLAGSETEDPDVLGAMLVAVEGFLKAAFKSGNPVDRMSYGDTAILFEHGSTAVLAVTVFGEPDRALKERMADAVERVERVFAGVIEHWDGDRTRLPGLEAILAPLWAPTHGRTRSEVLVATRGRSVEFVSAVEFFQGYVRVKLGIVNNTPFAVNGVTIDLDYNADVLRLVRLEPATYKSAGARVRIGSVGSGEKTALAYYFDPQICTTSSIEGTCVYRDLDGKQHAVEMKSRKAEVVCPLFFTKEQANTALLRRLIETELQQYDARAYGFNDGAREAVLGALFEDLKSAVLAHDVKLVRANERWGPYRAEAWFYGQTQVKGHQMVIRAAVDASKRRCEFFVASDVMGPITGLLAELHHTFSKGAMDRFGSIGLHPLFDERLRAEYANPAIVSKMVEGESAPGETETGVAGRSEP